MVIMIEEHHRPLQHCGSLILLGQQWSSVTQRIKTNQVLATQTMFVSRVFSFMFCLSVTISPLLSWNGIGSYNPELVSFGPGPHKVSYSDYTVSFKSLS